MGRIQPPDRHFLPLLALLVAAGVVVIGVGLTVYRAALSPAEVARLDARPSPVNWSLVRDDPNVTMDLTWLGLPDNANGRDGSVAQRLLEKRFNVRITPIFLDGNGYFKKKSLMFAGGAVPDVFWEMDPLILQRDVFHGFVLEVPHAVILRGAPGWVTIMNRTAPVGWLYANWNGRNYGLPTNYLTGLYSHPGTWRVDWLRNVGINRIPETLEEMHEALRRFTFDDPDRNGRRDTYGMSTDAQSWWWTTFGDISAPSG